MNEDEIEYAIQSYVSSNAKRIASQKRTIDERKALLQQQEIKIRSSVVNKHPQQQQVEEYKAANTGTDKITNTNSIEGHIESSGPSDNLLLGGSKLGLLDTKELERRRKLRSDRAARAYRTRLLNAKSRQSHAVNNEGGSLTNRRRTNSNIPLNEVPPIGIEFPSTPPRIEWILDQRRKVSLQ